MDSITIQQPSVSVQFNGEQNKMEKSINENGLSSRDNFPKGLRGGGPCFDCLACLCFCCAIDEIACFECCKDC